MDNSTVAEPENIRVNPDQLKDWMYELEDMAGYVCDELCPYHFETPSQEELKEVCEHCPVDVCMGKFLELTK